MKSCRCHCIVLPAVLLGACQPAGEAPPLVQGTTPVDPADRVLRNGAIYTVNDAQPWAEAVAIADGRFVAIGTDDEIDALVGEDTEVTDLQGRMAMPGMFDIHIHPVDGAMAALYDCSFPFTSTVEEILEHVASCVSEAEAGEWIRGGQWAVGLATLDQSISAELLDTVAPDNPVFLMDSTVHNAWVNSLALERLDIGPDTPDPEGGSIVRDSEGMPIGILIDDAAYNAISTLPDYSPEQHEEALAWIVAMLNRYGVTGFKDAIAEAGALRAYNALDQSGRLNARVAAIPELAPILWYPVPGVVEAQTAAIGRERAEFSFPIRSLVESSAEPAFGSDWPAVVPTPNPWPGVEALITRQDPYLEDPQEYKWAEQAVDLEAALEIVTINGAKALRVEEIAGSIEVGKSADLIVLDRNLFEIPVRDIAETQVLATIFEGRTVYEQSQEQ